METKIKEWTSVETIVLDAVKPEWWEEVLKDESCSRGGDISKRPAAIRY